MSNWRTGRSSIAATIRIFAVLIITVWLTGCGGSTNPTPVGSTNPTPVGSANSTPGGSSNSAFNGRPPAPPFSVNHKIPGFALGPFVLSGQNPNTGTVIPAAQLQYLIFDAAQYAVWIRTFGTSDTLQQAGQYIHQAGAKAMIGAYLANPSTTAVAQTNQQELDRLVTMANAGQADILTVGNETLLTGALTESQLLNYIAYVKAKVPASVQVSTVDTWSVLVNHPNVIAAVDVVLANIYPFWENSPETSALATLQSDYAQIRQASGTKQLMITETGWPSSGSPSSQAPSAIPSQANQRAYFLGAEQWARQNNIVMIWFEAYSEPWKANYNDYASWGIFNSNYVIESQFESAFQ
jgi:exo-beta-1,3-glucanase (GH17 family)